MPSGVAACAAGQPLGRIDDGDSLPLERSPCACRGMEAMKCHSPALYMPSAPKAKCRIVLSFWASLVSATPDERSLALA